MARDQLSDLNFVGGAKITGLPNATASGQAVTYDQLNSAVEGLAWKDSARVATVADLSLSSPGATIDGITMASGDRVLVKSQTLGQNNGIYLWNGAAVPMTRVADMDSAAEVEAAVVTVEEGTSAGSTFRQTAVNVTLNTTPLVWVGFGTAAAAASETVSGIAELATQAETDAGTDDLRIVTPLKLATYSNRKRKASGTIGDGSATTFTITHNFGMRDVQVEVYRNSGNYDTVICDVTRPTVNSIALTFASAPTAAQYGYVIIG